MSCSCALNCLVFFFFQAEDGIRDLYVTGVQTCALPILACRAWPPPASPSWSAPTAPSASRPPSPPPTRASPSRPPPARPPPAATKRPEPARAARTHTSALARRAGSLGDQFAGGEALAEVADAQAGRSEEHTSE